MSLGHKENTTRIDKTRGMEPMKNARKRLTGQAVAARTSTIMQR
jgi:hypothetical protein